LLATRALSASSDVLIAEPRVLRVHRPGRAPISLVARPGAKLVIPAGVEGGELFGRVLGDRIRPERVHFTGPSMASVYVEPDGLYASPALLPGDYQVEAEYRGGIRSDAVTANVVASRTTERFGMGTKDAGGVVISIAHEQCADGNRFDLTQPVEEDNRNSLRRYARGTMKDIGCDVVFEGLAPGQSRFVIQGPGRYAAMNDIKASKAFTVSPDSRLALTIGSPENSLAGVITMGNKPAGGVKLRLSAMEGSLFHSETVTDASGHYQVSAPDTGEYQLAVVAGSLFLSLRTGVRLSAGESRFDWRLPDSVLKVVVVSPPEARTSRLLTLDVRGSNGYSQFGYLTPDEHDASFYGLPDGRYEITAVSDVAVAMRPAQAEINSRLREVVVEITLEPVSEGRLRVINGQGVPLANARAQVGSRGLTREGPGSFVNDGTLAPGQWLTVSAPGYVPRCVVVTRTMLPSANVQLFPASPQSGKLRFKPALDSDERPGTIHGLPGSECPVGLEFFSIRSWKSDKESTLVEFGDLPEGTFGYAPSTRWTPQPLYVPGTELEFTRRPRPPQ
jgi:hypothetical protein